MRKTPLLNSHISWEISTIGHTQTICIGDCGLPVPENVRRVDIALTAGIPSFVDTLKVVIEEMQAEKAVLAEELQRNKKYCDEVLSILRSFNPSIEIIFVPHSIFKKQTESARAIIRTGEQTPYANIILQSGVVF